MEFSLIPALFAGLMATVVMALVMEGLSFKGLTSMPSLSLIVGSVFTDDRDTAMTIGNGIYFAGIGTVVSGIGYATVLSVIDLPGWPMGVLLGLVHGTIVGIALGMFEDRHPRLVEPGSVVARRQRPGARRSALVSKPGMFGVNWGDRTPIVLMASYAAHGLVYIIVYSALA